MCVCILPDKFDKFAFIPSAQDYVYLHRNNLLGKNRTGLTPVNNAPSENWGVYAEEELFAYGENLSINSKQRLRVSALSIKHVSQSTMKKIKKHQNRKIFTEGHNQDASLSLPTACSHPACYLHCGQLHQNAVNTEIISWERPC